MAKLKFNTNPEATNSFMPYDGETPPAGSYNARIKSPTLKTGRDSGKPYLNALFELDGNTGDNKKYNGFPLWDMVHFVSDSDNVLARWNSFIRAIGGKVTESGDIVHESDEDMASAKGSAVKSIAGTKVQDKLVRITIKKEKQEGYDERFRVELVSPTTSAGNISTDAEDEESDADEVEVEVESDEDDADEMTREEREAELKKYTIPDLRSAAKEAGLTTTGLKKPELVQLVLDWEYEDAEDDEAEDDDEDAEEAEDVEVEVESDEEEDEDEEEEDEDEEEEEEDVDEREEALAGLEGLDRTALKKQLKELDADAKVLKSMSDDDIKVKIVDLMTEPPF